MLARTAERFGYRPKRVVADTAYGSAAFLAFVRDQGAIPHIPVLERSEQAALGERLVGEGTSVREAAKLLKCHHPTLYRALSTPAA